MSEADARTDVGNEAAATIEIVVDVGQHNGAAEVKLGVADKAIAFVEGALSTRIEKVVYCDVASKAVSEIAADTATDAPGAVETGILNGETIYRKVRICVPVIPAIRADVPPGRRRRHRRHHRRILEAAAAVEISRQCTLRTAEDESRANEKYLTRR